MQHNYVCLDRRYASSEVIQGTEQLPPGPYSYWLDNTKYNTASIYFLNIVTDNPADAATIAYFRLSNSYYADNTVTKLPYVFTAPNILTVNTLGRVLLGNIILNKTAALAYCRPVNGLLQVIYPLDLQSAIYSAGYITLTLSTPRVFPVVKSLSTTWTVSQSKYRENSIFIPIKKIQKIKLLDFLYHNWLTDVIPDTGAMFTVLINEYASNAFQSSLGDYHFIFNINNKLQTPDNGSSLVTLAHLEGNIYPVNQTQTYVNDNIAEYQFDPPVDIKDTLTLTLGIMGRPLALNTGIHIYHMKFYVSLIDWKSNFQIWIQGNDLIRKLLNGFSSSSITNVTSFITITELTTTMPDQDAQGIKYATAPNGFILYFKTKYNISGSQQPQDPAGYSSPFGYITSLLQKSGEEYPTYPVKELQGNIITCKAFLNILNYRCELIFQGI